MEDRLTHNTVAHALVWDRVSPGMMILALPADHRDPSDDPMFMERFVGMVDDAHREAHFPLQ